MNSFSEERHNGTKPRAVGIFDELHISHKCPTKISQKDLSHAAKMHLRKHLVSIWMSLEAEICHKAEHANLLPQVTEKVILLAFFFTQHKRSEILSGTVLWSISPKCISSCLCPCKMVLKGASQVNSKASFLKTDIQVQWIISFGQSLHTYSSGRDILLDV